MNETLIKEQVLMAGLLARLGFEPPLRFGQELGYFCMLRVKERTQSFSVSKYLGGYPLLKLGFILRYHTIQLRNKKVKRKLF